MAIVSDDLGQNILLQAAYTLVSDDLGQNTLMYRDYWVRVHQLASVGNQCLKSG